MIKDIKVAMLTSWDGEEMHSRPMHGHQEEFGGKLYFFTKLDSGKTQEIGHYDKINLAYADVGSNTYVSISGRVRRFHGPSDAQVPGPLDQRLVPQGPRRSPTRTDRGECRQRTVLGHVRKQYALFVGSRSGKRHRPRS